MKFRGLVMAAFLFLSCLILGSENADAQGNGLQYQKIKPGRLSGSILDSARKRMEGKKIQVLDTEGRIIGSAVSDKYGMYQIANIPEGTFLLRVDNQTVARLQVTRGATVSSLKIVVPVKVEPLTPIQWTLIGVGGTAVIVGIVAIINNNDDSSTSYIPISP